MLVALLFACESAPPPPSAPPPKPPAPILDARAYPAVLRAGDHIPPDSPTAHEPPTRPRGWVAAPDTPEGADDFDHAYGWRALPRTPHEVCTPDVRDLEACSWEAGPFRVRWVGQRDLTWDEGEETEPPRYRAEPEASMAGAPWDLVDEEGGFFFRQARSYTNVPHRGCRTLRLVNYSGGAHCCDTNYLYTVCPEASSLTTVFAPDNWDDVDVFAADVDQDGNVELVYTDWTFYDFLPPDDANCARSGRVPFRRLLAWTRGGWHAAPLTPGRRAYYARSRADTFALQPKDATDDWEIGTVRGMTVGAYSHLSGASHERLLRDMRRALHAEVPRERLVHFDGSPCIDPSDIRAMKDHLQVDCVDDAPALAKVLVETLDRFEANRVEVVWSSRGSTGRPQRRER